MQKNNFHLRYEMGFFFFYFPRLFMKFSISLANPGRVSFIFLPVLFVFLSCVICSASSNALFLKRQSLNLVSLKQEFELSGPFLESWNMSNYISLCHWDGIKCDENGLVIALDISNLNISGTISSAITELPSLVNLSLAGNSFSGDLTSEIHKFSKLQFLNISNNIFSGNMSWDFSNLQELQVFDAYNNNFSGPLPVGLAKAQKLKHLNLGGNYFSGQIPTIYGSLIELNFLSLAGNDLGGFIPGELGDLVNLQSLYLGYYNRFNGGIPSELSRLINLLHLDLANCGLQGEIPKELGNLKKIDTLFLQTNQLSGSIPPELGNLTELESLDLSNNALIGEIPYEFSALKKLTLLNLFMNNLHGGIPSFIQDFPYLEVLKLWRNNFTGSIPSMLGQNGKLLEIDLSSNKLTGVLPKTLCYGKRLKILILLNNFLFGPLPDDLGQCTTLSRVRMGRNFFSGSIPDGFLYIPDLTLMELQDNDLTGSLKEANGGDVSMQLEGLNLSNNNLSGLLPKSIGKLSGLKILLLNGNMFNGEIPIEIGMLSRILKLDLSRNNFSGNVPPQIGNCSSLAYLDLSQNQISGCIPPEISQIHILNYFNISWNHMNQSLPKEISSLKSLTSADFSHNNFSGSIPETGQFLYFNSSSFLGNPNLCGLTLNPCNYSSSSQLELNNHQDNNKNKLPAKYKLIFALGLLIFSLIFTALAIFKTRNVRRRRSNPWKITAFQKLEFVSQDIISCLEENNIIGRGGAGVVYKGTMPNGELVAVKKLSISKGSSDHDHGLSAEIQTLGSIRHRYIVRLLAFCTNKETNLLVYEYMPNGSLGEVLHGKSGAYLQWDTRFKIAMEASKGLCYLHHDCSPLIIHRDVKSNNILLTSDFEAHIADFGLAKFLFGNGTSECMSAIAGSYGYIAPEYAYTLNVDEKSDVYSFGVVILELITGRRPVGDFGESGLDIVQWVNVETKWRKEEVVKILDQRLKNVAMNEAMQVFFVAMLCVQEQSIQRPTMRDVVQMLAQAKQPDTFHLQ